MLTGAYLFESCLTDHYFRLVTDPKLLATELKRSKQLCEMGEAEMADLSSLLQGMLHPDLSQRLSISALLEHQSL